MENGNGNGKLNPWSKEFLERAENQEFEFDAKVVDAYMQYDKIKDSKGNDKNAEFLILKLEPTSYDGETKEIKLKVSENRNSKWVAFLNSLFQSGANIDSSSPSPEKSLIGLEFHWIQKNIGEFVGSDGTPKKVFVYLPVKLLSSTNVQPAQTQTTVQQTTDTKLSDNETKVVEWLKKSTGGTVGEISKQTGIKISEIMPICNSLVAKGKVLMQDRKSVV